MKEMTEVVVLMETSKPADRSDASRDAQHDSLVAFADVPEYSEADGPLLPCDHGETWGMVVNEAAASRFTAVVSNQVGCHRDLITEDVTQMAYACGDTEALAGCVQRRSASRQAAFDMGLPASTRVRQHCSFRLVMDGSLAAPAYVCPLATRGLAAPLRPSRLQTA